MKSRAFWSIAILAGLLIPGISAAQVGPTFWMGGSGGFGTYSMGDINDGIKDFNAASGLKMDEISNGFAFGLSAGINVTPMVSLGIGYERIMASTDIGSGGVAIDFNVPANIIYGEAQYTLPSASVFHFGFAGGLGMVLASGEYSETVPGEGAFSGDVKGSSFLFHGRLVGEIDVAPKVALTPSVGYRLAKVGEYEIADETAYKQDGSKQALDYSGLLLRFGVKFKMN